MRNLTLIEKYRPESLEDIYGNDLAIKWLKKIVRNPLSLPHLILTGPSGVGKTSAIHCMAKSILGKEMKNAFMEINASEKRGVEALRQKIPTFAQKKVSVPYKIVMIDDVDSLNNKVQQTLTGILEKFESKTRFIFITQSPMIESIQSRSNILHLRELTDGDIEKKLVRVLVNERVQYNEDGIEALCFVADGDMRVALNYLHACYQCFGKILGSCVYAISDSPTPSILEECLGHCLAGDIVKAGEIVKDIQSLGYSTHDVIQTLFKILRYYEMDHEIRFKYMSLVGDTQMNMVSKDGTDCQLWSLIGKMAMVK